MSSFTPGPWHYGHLGTEVLWIGPDYKQTPVAHVDHDMEFARDNSRANARLIAAAPEMLEALKSLVEYGESNEDPEVFPEEHLRLNMARAAIAKAEGRS